MCFILNNEGTLEFIFEGNYVLIREVGSSSKVLVFDSNSSLLHNQIQTICGIFCYSNQQTEWASDLASELLSKYNQIINYLKGTNINLDGLNVSTVDLLKSCNGMLGIADLLMGRSLDDVYNQLRLIGLPESLNNIVPIISAVVSGASDYVVDSLSDPKFWAGVAGGIMFEAGMIATCTGVGAPVGLALMGAGTLCTAYSCGLLDFDSKGITFNVTNENIACFVFSMVCNGVSGGYSGIVSKSTFKLAGSEVMQIASLNAVVDSRGLYASTITRKYVVYEGSGNTASKYIINRLVDSQNPVTSDYVKKSIFSSVDYSIQGVIWKYYFKNALNYY